MSALASYAFAVALVLAAAAVVEWVVPRVIGARPWIQFAVVWVFVFGGPFLLHYFELAVGANVLDTGPSQLFKYGMIPIGGRRAVALLKGPRTEFFARVFFWLVALAVAGMGTFAIAQRFAR